MFAQAGDDSSGEPRGPRMVGEGIFIDDVIAGVRAQQFEEVEAASLNSWFRTKVKWALPIWVQNPFLAFLTRPGVVDCDPRRVRQPARNTARASSKKVLLAGDQEANNLSLGDENAEPPQQRDQPSHRDLPLMILGEHEAAQFGSEMTIDVPAAKGAITVRPSGVRQHARRKWGDVRADDQILHEETGIAFETRAEAVAPTSSLRSSWIVNFVRVAPRRRALAPWGPPFAPRSPLPCRSA